MNSSSAGRVLLLLSAISCIAWPAGAFAQAWPSKPVKIIVPFGVGGPADIYARFVGARLSDSMGQPFVLLRDLAPVAPVNYSDLLMVVHPDVQSNNLRELIAQAKAHPGKLNYASSGPGTPYHMAGELFKTMAGVDIVHVPYKGSDGARAGILGGQVHMMLDAITTMAPNVRAGKLKAMGTTGKTRSNVLPDVPTISEAGVPGYETGIWLGLMAPAGTPRAVLERLNAEVRKVLDSSEVKASWGKQGATPMGMTIDQFDKFLREDITKWAGVVKATGMKVD